MSWFDTFKNRLNALMGRPSVGEIGDDYDDSIADPDLEGSTTGPLGRFAVAVLLFPFQVLFLPLKALGLFHNSGVDVEFEEAYQEMSLSGKVSWAAKWLGLGMIKLPYLILTAPIRFFRGLSLSNSWDILFAIPALLMVCFFAYVFTQVFARAEVIQNRYARGVTEALAKNDFKRAKTYFNRLLQEGELSRPNQLQLFIVLTQTGEFQKAEEVLDDLAPEDNLGYGPAHALKAVRLAGLLVSGQGKPDTLERLGRHLNRTDQQDPETLQAWTIYYRKMGQHDKAIQKMTDAARKNPALFLGLSNYLIQLNRPNENRVVLQEAATKFRDIVLEKPTNHFARIALANILTRLDRIGEAEQVLTRGLDLKDGPEIRRALASFYSLRYEQARFDGKDTEQQLSLLVRGLNYDPHNKLVYENLMRFSTSDDKTPEQMEQIKSELRQIIGGSNPSAVAHFVMSNILYTEGDQDKAKFHLEMAYEVNNELVVVLNNLAWILATQEDPDLERALELAEKVVKTAPEDGRYRDTRGTIYLKKGRYKDAIADFEISLRAELSPNNPKIVHKKLYEAYTALEMHEMAKTHLQNSQ